MLFFIDESGHDHGDAPYEVLAAVAVGAAYHRAATARDRDKLRQAILEGLGWKLYRIWSTDWWHDAPGETQKLLKHMAALGTIMGVRQSLVVGQV